MGVRVVRPSGRKGLYIPVCEDGKRFLRHAESREADFAAKKEIEISLASGTFRKPGENPGKMITFGEYADKWMTGYVGHNLKWNSNGIALIFSRGFPTMLRAGQWTDHKGGR